MTRLLGELEGDGPVLDLPRRRIFQGDPAFDLSTSIHGHRAATPFGPAAGPHTQLAQNLALSWLAGGRVLELKTVQIKDDLVIPRPCIDMQTVGFNVEWSQELTLQESLREYVKGAMLIELMKASGVAPGRGDTVLDMSVGYDLAGIRSDRVRDFLGGMLDASALVGAFRAEIPARWSHLRDLPFPTRLSDTLTLSTFHGCPPEEIERICEFLLDEVGLHVVVKLNPTLLGQQAVLEILHDRLGYRELAVPSAAFEKDARWEQVEGIVERLGRRARDAGRGLGVKCTNTLIVKNHKQFFPATEREMYLSGAPLHVLAMALVRRLRQAFGDRYPVSFSAGVDATNFPDAVAIGLNPVTVCSDLLGPGGYGRAARYFTELAGRMKAVGATDLDTFSIRAYGHGEAALARLGLAPEAEASCRAALRSGGELRAAAGSAFPAWASAARLLDTETYAARALADDRYAAARNRTPPRKVGSALALFDCLTCDKCIPVCPNDANFSLPVATGAIALERLVPQGDGRFRLETTGSLEVVKERQIANLADACNACGHCDVMCPEDGGPYVVKPRFFASVEGFLEEPALGGVVIDRVASGLRVHARVGGRVMVVEGGPERVRFRGEGFDLRLDPRDPAGTAEGRADAPVDLTWLRIIERLRDAVLASGATTWVGAAIAPETATMARCSR